MSANLDRFPAPPWSERPQFHCVQCLVVIPEPLANADLHMCDACRCAAVDRLDENNDEKEARGEL